MTPEENTREHFKSEQPFTNLDDANQCIASLRGELRAIRDSVPENCVVICREGGGLEDVASSVALSVNKLAKLVRERRDVFNRLYFVELDPETDKPLHGSTGYAVHRDSETIADGFMSVQGAALFAGLANAYGPEKAARFIKTLEHLSTMFKNFNYPI